MLKCCWLANINPTNFCNSPVTRKSATQTSFVYQNWQSYKFHCISGIKFIPEPIFDEILGKTKKHGERGTARILFPSHEKTKDNDDNDDRKWLTWSCDRVWWANVRRVYVSEFESLHKTDLFLKIKRFRWSAQMSDQFVFL